METVGVRELRQDASALLARVQATGDSIEITSHGRPIARLTPIETGSGRSREHLIAAGVLRPGRGDPLEVVPVSPPPGGRTSDDLLAELRDDR